MNTQIDAYLQYGIEIPARASDADLQPLYNRTERIIQAIRKDGSNQASASIGYMLHENGDGNNDANAVWLSLVLSLQQQGLVRSEEAVKLPSSLNAACDLYDPLSERQIRVTEYVGPLVVEDAVLDSASNFSILSAVHKGRKVQAADVLTLVD